MNFVNLKTFKSVLKDIAKVCGTTNSIRLTLSKDGSLAFLLLIGSMVQMRIPLESKAVKQRSSFEKEIDIPVELLVKIVTNLPVTMEEVDLEITDSGKLKLSGDNIEYELNGISVAGAEFVLSEERIAVFKTNAEIANVLQQASSVTKKEHPILSYINVIADCEFGELVVQTSDSHRIYQKRLYALEQFDSTINFSVASQLGKALGKLVFETTEWQVFQNFVKVTLDGKVEILAARSLLDYPNLTKFEDKSQHVSFLVNPHELKARLSKIKKDVNLWIYNLDGVLAIEYTEQYGDGNAISWVKTQQQTKPAYMRINSGLLTSALKPIKKITKEMIFKLPKFEVDADFNESNQIGFVEFGGNSYLIAGLEFSSNTPPGVKEWLIGCGWSIIPESQPVTTVATSVVDLSSRWNGTGWKQPEIVECECGNICDLTTSKRKNGFQLFGECPFCPDGGELDLTKVEYSCLTLNCGISFVSTPQTPVSQPVCPGCKGTEFDTLHTFLCLGEKCKTEVEYTNIELCYCGAPVINEILWSCDQCLHTFREEDLTQEVIEQYARFEGGKVIGYSICPLCVTESTVVANVEYTSCTVCGQDEHGVGNIITYVPLIEAPFVVCAECKEETASYPRESINDPFVVGDLVRV